MLPIIYTLIIAHAQPTFPQYSKYAMQIGGGVAGSFVGWAVGYNAALLFDLGREGSRTVALSSALLLSTTSTYLIGEMFGQGNILPTFLGGLLFGIASNMMIRDNNPYRYYIVPFSFTIGGVIGYNLFKRRMWEEGG